MDTVAKYRQAVREVPMPLTKRRYANTDLVNEAVFDVKNDRYIIASHGWQNGTQRMHGVLVHLDIIGDKVWIHRDGTEEGIAYDLEEAGVPKQNIVLAFHQPRDRMVYGYAAS